MNAGEINIAVTADMNRFQATMNAVKQNAADTSVTAGRFFRDKFASELSPQKMGKILGAAVGIGFAESMVRRITESIKNDTSIASALRAQVDSLPVIGAAYGLGEAISERLTGVAQERARQQARLQSDIAQQEQYAAEDRAREEQEKNAKETADRIAKFEAQTEDSHLERKLIKARANGDEMEAIRIEAIRRMNEIEEQEQELLSKAMTTNEKDAISALSEARKEALSEEIVAKRQAVEKERAEERKAEAERAEQERKKTVSDLMERRKKIEQERIDAVTSGIGSAMTGLGTFKFDAYPASDKKANDQAMVKELTEINRKIGAAGGGFN